MTVLRSTTIIFILLITAVAMISWWAAPPLFTEPKSDPLQSQEVHSTPFKANDKALIATWEKDIKPMLEHYCYDCHGDGMDKGKLDLDQYPDLASMRANPKIWEHIQARIDYHLMPPPDEEQPSREKRDQLITWINDAIFPIDPNNLDPGHVVIRRMNRIEYQNTIHDLLGVKITTKTILPPDDSGHGFDNIGSALTISPTHIEKYLHAAELALNKAIVIGPVTPPLKNFPLRKLRGDGRKSKEGIYLTGRGAVKVNPLVKRAGTYRLHIQASAQQAGAEPAFLDVLLKGRQIRRFKVANPLNDKKHFSLEINLHKGRNNLNLAFPNDFYNPKARDPKRKDRNLMIHQIRLEGPTDIEYEKPDSHQRIFIPREKNITDQHYARNVLATFARRAFRRPVTKAEISRYLQLAKTITKKESSLEQGIKGALHAMLVSPSFLFIGNDPTVKATQPSTLIGEHALANRLSYFLWSSMPDDTLLELADRNKLRTNLNQQVLRMLKHDRAKQFIRHFSGQWLQLRDLNVVTPDLKHFPEFDNALRKDMRTETEMFVEHILRHDRSLLEFLDADYSFINERLASHYQINRIQGSQFRRVQLDNSHRRGLLTHASLLTITSQPTRTSAVLRGKFILENILDITPPPPPPNLPQLEDQEHHDQRLTLREQLTMHREKTACAGCHNLMDPVGLAFEHFDAIGRFREFDNGRAIDASGKLVTGEKLVNAESLRKVISTNKRDEFIRCLTVKMMTYALGRGTTRYDRLSIEKILRAVQQKDYSSRELILGIINSTPFQYQGHH